MSNRVDDISSSSPRGHTAFPKTTKIKVNKPNLAESGDHAGAIGRLGLAHQRERLLGVLQLLQVETNHSVQILGCLVRLR